MKSLKGVHNIIQAVNTKFLKYHYLFYSDTKSTGCEIYRI